MKKVSGFAFLAILATISFLHFHCADQPPAASAGNDSLVYLNHHDSVKYVGIETCRSCHGAIYNTFIQTGMGQSFNLASRQKSAAGFGKKHVVYDEVNDFYYTVYWQGDEMMMLEFRLQGRDTIHKRSEHVKYIIGSGQHTNSHIMEVNGYLYQMPMTWYAQQKKWDLPPGFENGRNSRFTRMIGEECMSCHNALPQMVQGSENRYTSVPRGIDCERCHGPGELHVKEKLAGHRVDTSNGRSDYTIVNPRKLPWERQIDLCQRCHLQGNSVLKPGKTFRDFRPGMKLSDSWDVFMPRYAGADDEFIMASHADRLQQSQCFIQSNKGQQGAGLRFTCITCHNPHVSVKVTGREVFSNACIACHNSKNSKTCNEPTVVKLIKQTADVHQQKSVDCAGCHMPRSGTTDIPHVTVHDHYIRKRVSKQKAGEVKRYIGIACVNEKNPDPATIATAFTSYYERFEGPIASLDSALFWSSTVTKNENYFNQLVQVYYLQNNSAKAVAVSEQPGFSTSDAWTCYRIGQSFMNLGQYDRAAPWLQKAVQKAPYNLGFLNKWGEVQLQKGKIGEAIKTFEELLQLQPKYVAAINNLGFAWLNKHELVKAAGFYEQALKIDPDYEPALLNKAGLYNLTGEKNKAKAILQKLLKRKPGDNHLKQILEQIG